MGVVSKKTPSSLEARDAHSETSLLKTKNSLTSATWGTSLQSHKGNCWALPRCLGQPLVQE